MIRIAREGEITWMSDISLSDIPHPLPKGFVIHVNNEIIGIEIQGLVGSLRLNNGDSLHIIPKIGRVNFLRLLFKAEGKQLDLEREYESFVDYSIDDEDNIDFIVARHLFYCVDTILRRSPKTIRVKKLYRGNFACGQLDYINTLLNIACHKDEPISYWSNFKSVNTPENRIITEALIRSWHHIHNQSNKVLFSIYENWLKRFPRSNNLFEDIIFVEQSFASGKYGGPRDYYRKALMISQIILGNIGIGFYDASVIEGDAILLNSSNIFEKYIRNSLREAYNNSGYIITKGGQNIKFLYIDGSYELQPDIVISKDGQTILIADVKYKKPSNSDHYQLYTYLSENSLTIPLFSENPIRFFNFIRGWME